MTRNRIVALLAVVASLALASVALAAKVTGGTTTLTLSSAATQALSANNLTVAPIAPATASGSTFTFPITGGRLNQKLHGKIVHSGGFTISNGTKTVQVRHLTLYSSSSGVSLFARVPGRVTHGCVKIGKHAKKCATVFHYYVERIARVTGVTVSSGSATGTVKVTAASARLINRLAGKQIISAGDAIGTATVTPTVA